MYVRRHVPQIATGWSGHSAKSSDLSRTNTNTMRASLSSKHEPVKPGREIIRRKMWILVDNARTPQTLLHLLPRIALSPFAGTYPPRAETGQNSTAHSGAASSLAQTRWPVRAGSSRDQESALSWRSAASQPAAPSLSSSPTAPAPPSGRTRYAFRRSSQNCLNSSSVMICVSKRVARRRRRLSSLPPNSVRSSVT